MQHHIGACMPPTLDLTIQMIEYTIMHDRFLDQAIKTKHDKYDLLIIKQHKDGLNFHTKRSKSTTRCYIFLLYKRKVKKEMKVSL